MDPSSAVELLLKDQSTTSAAEVMGSIANSDPVVAAAFVVEPVLRFIEKEKWSTIMVDSASSL